MILIQKPDIPPRSYFVELKKSKREKSSTEVRDVETEKKVDWVRTGQLGLKKSGSAEDLE